MLRTSTIARASLILAAATFMAIPAMADDMSAEAAYADMAKSFGSVPSFVKEVPKSAVAGLWQQTKDLEFSENTALPPKVKALISLAVAAQIPCTYCIWSDTQSARQAGATDEEIKEAVAMAGLTRQWSTIFNGMQVDFEQFKKELAVK